MSGFHKYCNECDRGLYIRKNDDGSHVVFSAFEKCGGCSPVNGEWALARDAHLDCNLCSDA